MRKWFHGPILGSTLVVFSPVLFIGLVSIAWAPTWQYAQVNSMSGPGDSQSTCLVGPEYYEISLVSTRKLPGTYGSIGVVEVQFASSPFGVAMSSDGEYIYDLRFKVEKISRPEEGQYVAWLATPNLDHVVHVGPLSEDFTASGQVDFNKYLVIVSLEEAGYSTGRWKGPIALRGLSRSGMMHTSIGHGLFEDEPCTQYGFN